MAVYVGTAITTSTLLISTIQIPFKYHGATKKINKLTEEILNKLKDAERRLKRLSGHKFCPPSPENQLSDMWNDLKEFKTQLDKITGDYEGKGLTVPKRLVHPIRTKRRLSDLKKRLDCFLGNVKKYQWILACAYSSSHLLSTSNKLCRELGRLPKAILGIARKDRNGQECLANVRKCANDRNQLAILTLGVVSNLELVPGTKQSHALKIYKKFEKTFPRLKAFIEGTIRLNRLGKYKDRSRETYKWFKAVLDEGYCEFGSKAVYSAALCIVLKGFGGPRDMKLANEMMKTAADWGEFCGFVHLAAAYKHGFGFDVNLEEYAKIVSILKERGHCNNRTVEEAAFRFAPHICPFHGCDIDCCYEGFCYLHGICVERDRKKGLKLIGISAKKGHRLARIIYDHEKNHS